MLSLRFSFHSKEVMAPRERSESSVPSYTGLPDAPRRSVGFTSCTGPRTSDEKRGKSQTIIYGRKKHFMDTHVYCGTGKIFLIQASTNSTLSQGMLFLFPSWLCSKMAVPIWFSFVCCRKRASRQNKTTYGTW